jgi:hypothetical protein
LFIAVHLPVAAKLEAAAFVCDKALNVLDGVVKKYADLVGKIVLLTASLRKPVKTLSGAEAGIVAVVFKQLSALWLAKQPLKQGLAIKHQQAALSALAEYFYPQAFLCGFLVETPDIRVNIKLVFVKTHQAR